MSGLVTGLQNRLRRFESARHLTSERYPLPQRISFFFIPNRYFGSAEDYEHQHLMGYLRGYLRGYLMGCLMGLQVHFYVFLLFIYPPNMVFIRNFPMFSRNIMGKGLTKESVMFLLTFEGKDENIWGKRWERLRESWLTFEGKEFHFILPAEILAYGTRAVSWSMFLPL